MSKKPFVAGPETALKDGPLGRDGILVRREPTLKWQNTNEDGEITEGKIKVHGRARIGSSEQADIRVDDEAVSRLHAEVELLDDGLWVSDLESKNGTFVNEILVERARIPTAGTIRVGGTTISVNYAKSATPVDLWPDDHFCELIGGSRPMRELYQNISKVAPRTDTVLIEGETGTGKELVARAIHQTSDRSGGPFVVFDCGAVHAELLERELFGHVKGAFTGAETDSDGCAAAANGGTLFLDEIGELPVEFQPKLLRLLETKTYKPVGANEHVAADVRFVAATHRNLGEMVNRGSFREDLFFRISPFVISVPSLRVRPSDIPDLVAHLAGESTRGVSISDLATEALARSWPGNVRQLRSFVARRIAFGKLEANDSDEKDPPKEPRTLAEGRDRVIEAYEQNYITELLKKHDGVVTAAAETAGVNRSYLHRLIRKYNL